jgi:Flp pilus assembly protein TadD
MHDVPLAANRGSRSIPAARLTRTDTAMARNIGVFSLTRTARPARAALCGVALALMATGCASRSDMTATGAIAPSQTSPAALAGNKPIAAMNAGELQQAAARIGNAYERAPQDRTVGMGYASILQMTGNDSQALAVMQQVAIHHPSDQEVLAAFAKAQAAAGDFERALQSIQRAQTPDRPDWKLLSAEGAILDQLDRPNEARQRYRAALDIAPNEPSVLSNLGMSYLLANDLRSAETYMRQAASQPTADSRVRQNLALVIGLQGRFDEAQRIARDELSPEQADANMAYMRAMLSQQNAWSQLSDNQVATNTN